MCARTFCGNAATNHPMCDGIDPVKPERNNMRKALLAVAGAALMGTILVAPAYSEVGHTFSVSVDPDRLSELLHRLR